MASTVQTGGGSGVDLSELTSGERHFIAMFNSSFYKPDGVDARIEICGLNASPQSDPGAYTVIDLSNIKSVTHTGHIYNVYGGATKNETTVANLSNNASYGLMTSCYVTSYTTKDGKVHTANNLNY